MNASARSSPPNCCPGPRSSSSKSPPRHLTRRRARRCCACCGASPTAASPWCSPRAARSTPPAATRWSSSPPAGTWRSSARPAAALGYFGADSLEEIFERLAGLGDPAAAWSRRFFHFSRTRAGFTVPAAAPPPVGPAVLLPDAAGPHSAGRVSADLPAGDSAGRPYGRRGGAAGEARRSRSPRGCLSRAACRPAVRPVGAVLTRRNAEVLARDQAHAGRACGRARRRYCSRSACCSGAGALDGRGAVTLAWAVLGGVVAGLAYQLPARAAEAGILRRERFAGLSTGRVRPGQGHGAAPAACARRRAHPGGPRHRRPSAPRASPLPTSPCCCPRSPGWPSRSRCPPARPAGDQPLAEFCFAGRWLGQRAAYHRLVAPTILVRRRLAGRLSVANSVGC